MAEEQHHALEDEQGQVNHHCVAVVRLIDCYLGNEDCYLNEAATDQTSPEAVVKQAEEDKCGLEISLSHVATVFKGLAREENGQRAQ